MFNEMYLDADTVKNIPLITEGVSLSDLFPEKVFAAIEKFKFGEIDNLIIHGAHLPHVVPETPQEIRKAPVDVFPAYVIESIGDFLGKISDKKVENSIRFRSGTGYVNEETWHGHYQYKYSVFYCLRADEEAKTYFFSANTLIQTAPSEIATLLVRPLSYIQGDEPFPLISKNKSGYEISHYIYGRSDIEQYIKDLDLPDVTKTLAHILADVQDESAKKAVEYLLNALKNCPDYISYKPGDIALYNEECTMRFSPGYTPSTQPIEDRWILALSVQK